MDINTTRRRLFLGMLNLPLIAVFSATRASSLDPDEELERHLLGLLSDPHAAAAIGTEYLNSSARSWQRAELVRALRPQGERVADRRQLATWLLERQRDDFGADRTVTLQGWTLSLTEARLCALTALSWPPARGRYYLLPVFEELQEMI